MQPYPLVLDIISGCWLVFVAIWVIAALSTKRTVYRETHAQRLRYWVLLVIACFLLVYTGILTMFFATALALGHLAGLAATLLMFASFRIKLCDEERLMLQQFPDRYAAYRRRAKRIIPFVL